MCALLCRNGQSNDLKGAIGCRLHGEWEIQDRALTNGDVRAWLKLPPIPSSILPSAQIFSARREKVTNEDHEIYCESEPWRYPQT
jgi:hypothetical protein